MGAETRHIAQRSSLTLAFVVGVLLAGSLGSDSTGQSRSAEK